MLKKTLIAATALSAVALGAASPASAHYKGHYNFSWYAGYPSWSYSICHYETRPLTLKIWDPYTYSYYFKTVYRDVQDLRLARIVRARRLLLSLGRMRAAAFPQGCSPSFIYLPRSSTSPPRSTASAPAV